MPTTKKTLMFLSGFFTSFGAFIVACVALGTQEWVSSQVAISDTASHGNIVVTYGLFRGRSTQELAQGLTEPDKHFEVLGKLNSSSPKTLHWAVILALGLSLSAALLSSGFTFYNSVGNPYQTFLGPIGVYTWSGLGASLAFLAMVLFVGNVQATHLSEALAQALYPLYASVIQGGMTHTYGYSFWLLLLVVLLDLVTVVIVVFYQKARYQQKQEQKKPMEYAPKDGILF